MITFDDFKANTKEWLIDKLADMSLKEASQTISDLYDKLHKPKYPKTYEECCRVIRICSASLQWDNPFCVNRNSHPYIKHLDILMENLCKLLICRDTYWKIAGEQMGLSEPWEPDWIDEITKYGIGTDQNIIFKDNVVHINRILVFPTEEIRDAFYENFKDLIEQCKELL